MPFDEAVFGGPARNESRHYWMQREGAEPMLLPGIERRIGALRSENRDGNFRGMSTKFIAQQLADLQKRVEALEIQVKPAPKGTWRDAIGFAKDDELFDEAMRLGAEWRAKANREGR